MYINSITLFRQFVLRATLILALIGMTACSSPEDKANKFYENGILLLEKNELIKADVEFRNALQLNPKMSKAIWGQVTIAEKKGNYSKQYKLLNTFLSHEPEHIEALVKVGRILLAAGQIDKALEKSDLLMTINNEEASVVSLRAAIMLKLGDTAAAIKLAKKVLASDSHNLDALLVLATERLAAGDAKKALGYIERGLVKNDKNVSFLLIKIKALEILSKVDLAADVFIRLVNDYPKVVTFKNLLGQFYLKHSRKDDAEKIYRIIVEDNPKNLKAKINLVRFLNRFQGKDAGLKQLQAYSEQNPENDELKFAIVQFHVEHKEITQARQQLEKIVGDKEGSERGLKAKGMIASLFLSQGDKKSAEKLINEILVNDKQNQVGLILKAGLDVDSQKYDEAISALRIVLRDEPDSSRALFFLAKAYNLSGSPELADEQYFKLFKTSKYNANYGITYAQFLLKRKQHKRAEKIIQDALSVSPNNLQLLKLLAQTHLLLGDWVSAQEVADTIKHYGDKDNLATYISNAIMVGKKDYSESITLLKKTYQSTPESIQPIVALVRTYMLSGKSQQAGEFLDAVISASPKNTSARILRGQIYASQGKKEEAINTYREAIIKDPQNVMSYYHLAVIYMSEKQYEYASEVLNKGLSISPKSFPIRITLASLYETMGQSEKAIKEYEGLLKIRPDAEVVSNNLASLLTENRVDKASLKRAYDLSKRFKYSEVAQFKDTFGWSSYHVGKYTDAKLLLESAIKMLPSTPEFHYHLGMNYLAIKNKVKARKELEKALKYAENKTFVKADEVRTILEKL